MERIVRTYKFVEHDWIDYATHGAPRSRKTHDKADPGTEIRWQDSNGRNVQTAGTEPDCKPLSKKRLPVSFTE